MRTELIVFVDVVVEVLGEKKRKIVLSLCVPKTRFYLFFSQLISQETQSSPLEIRTVSHPALIRRVCGQWVVFDRGSM